MKGLYLSGILLALAGGASAEPAPSDQGRVRCFQAAPTFLPVDQEAVVDNQTVTFQVQVNCAGADMVVRLSNEHGREPVSVGKAKLTAADKRSGVLTFAGRETVVIPAGQAVESDPLAFSVAAGDYLDVQVHFQQKTRLATIHRDPLNLARISGVETATPMRPLLSAIDVRPVTPMRTIVAFGDSISDWDCAYGAERCQWEAVLQDRLHAAGKPYAVSNAAISANRILHDSPSDSPIWKSLSAEARFERDVLSVPGVSHIIWLEGINDIAMSCDPAGKATLPPTDCGQQITAGMARIIQRAHDRGLKIYGAEILPFKGHWAWTPEREAVRLEVNRWIRGAAPFDGLIGFGKAVVDPSKPEILRTEYDNGDHLHPNAAGQRAMGAAIPLNLFP